MARFSFCILGIILAGCSFFSEFTEEVYTCTHKEAGTLERISLEKREYSKDFSRERAATISIEMQNAVVVKAHLAVIKEDGTQKKYEIPVTHPSISEAIKFCDKELEHQLRFRRVSF